MARPFKLFRDYEFFGVLFPGLSAVVFLYMLLPSNIHIGLPAGVIFVLVFAFMFGQALHSVALIVESLPETVLRTMDISWSHRQEFREQLNNPTYLTEAAIIELRRKAAEDVPGVEYYDKFSPSLYSDSETRAIYLFIRSELLAQNLSRYDNLKAMYGFCRNMCVLLFGLLPLYWTYGFLDSSSGNNIGFTDLGIIDRKGKYIEYFPDYYEFLESAFPLAIIGGTIFLFGTFIYQRFYIQYLVTDYLAANNSEGLLSE